MAIRDQPDPLGQRFGAVPVRRGREGAVSNAVSSGSVPSITQWQIPEVGEWI